MSHANAVPRVLFACLVAATAASCSDGGVTYTIDETRRLDHARPEQTTPLDTQTRMGLKDPAGAGGASAFRHPPMDGSESPGAANPEESDFSWAAPDGWTQGPAKQMRLVTFVPNDTVGVECYVTVLGGAAGGVEANVNRWRQQLHLAPLSADAVASLPTVVTLGRTAPMVEIDGGAVGTFGLVCELGAQTVFVKMTGPMDELRAERERFVAFCKSLSQS